MKGHKLLMDRVEENRDSSPNKAPRQQPPANRLTEPAAAESCLAERAPAVLDHEGSASAESTPEEGVQEGSAEETQPEEEVGDALARQRTAASAGHRATS